MYGENYMIDRISIQAFKSIQSLTVTCKPLNVFVGKNLSGKSAFLQGLLLIAQQTLNGRYIYVGQYQDVKNQNTKMKDQPIRIDVWENQSSTPAGVTFFTLENERDTWYKYVNKKPLIHRDFYYVSPHNPDYESKGMVTDQVFDKLNNWLDFIVGIRLDRSEIQEPRQVEKQSPSMQYLIRILLICLMAKEDSVIIIENPEIYLHPKAQSRLSTFLYVISLDGPQLFVETHSDHIFNKLRVGLATKRIQEDVAINFFVKDDEKGTQCNPILIKEHGKMVGTNPELDLIDLFDQFEIDLNNMLNITG